MGISPTIIAAGVGAAGSIGGALINSGAAGAQTSALQQGQNIQEQALQEQLQLQHQALQQEQAQYQQNLTLEQPYMSAGQGALNEYDQLLGITPTAAPTYDTNAYATAMNSYNADINAAPLTAAQFKALSPQAQQFYTKDAAGSYVVNNQTLQAPQLSNFSTSPTNPYDMGAYNSALQQWELSQQAPAGTVTTTHGGGRNSGGTPTPTPTTTPPPTATPMPTLGSYANPGYGAPAPTPTGPTAATMQGALTALENTPGYQFQLQQGLQAIQNGASATTGVLSTAENQAATRYAEGLAGTTYENFMNRLGGLVTTGQGATDAAVGAGNANLAAQTNTLSNSSAAIANTANNQTQLSANIGAAQASGYSAMGAGLTSGANNFANSYLLSSLMGGGGGGTGILAPGSSGELSSYLSQTQGL